MKEIILKGKIDKKHYMRKYRALKTIMSIIILLTMTAISVMNGVPEQVHAAAGVEQSVTTYLNSIVKYLYLGKKDTDTFDFNINNDMQKQATSYAWYVKADKGTPTSVKINKKTGVVTALEAGTAYIRCKITLEDGTVIRPEAKVIVINNITEVRISNFPKNLTITTGEAKDFNSAIMNTTAGKGKKSKGVTRWEIAKDTTGVDSATVDGIVSPIKEGAFNIRAVCFQSTAEYKLWLADKKANVKYVTAASEWTTIKVVASKTSVTVSTQKQLNNALADTSTKQITIATPETVTFTIPKADYSDKTLIVNAANADVENYATFQGITINAIKDNTWREYGKGNQFIFEDSGIRIIVDEEADIKNITINAENSVINIVANGKINHIEIMEPSNVVFTGSGSAVPVTVEKTAQGSSINSSVPLNLEIKSKAEVILNKGSETTILDKSESSIDVTIVNQTTREITITTNNNNGEKVDVGKTVVSDETTKTPSDTTPSAGAASSAGAAPSGGGGFSGGGAPSGSGGSSGGTPQTPTQVAVSSVTVNPTTMSLTAGGATKTISATVLPTNATNSAIAWISSNINVATVSNGVVTPLSAGEVTITAISVADSTKSAITTVTVDPSGTSLTAYTIKTSSNFDNFSTIAHAITLGDNNYTLFVKLAVDNANSTDKIYIDNNTTPVITGITGFQMKSSDTHVLSVDDAGNLIPIATGSAIILVKYKQEVVGSAYITVGARREISAVTLDNYSISLSNSAADTKKVTVTVKDQLNEVIDASKYSIKIEENTVVTTSALKVLFGTDTVKSGTTTPQKFYFTGTNAAEGTYVYKITATDNTSSKDFSVYITVNVDAPVSTPDIFYWRLETDATTYDMNLGESSGDDTCNVTLNLFGYSKECVKTFQADVSGGTVTTTVLDPNGNAYAMSGTTTGTISLITTTGASLAKKAPTGTWTVRAVSGSSILAESYFTVKDTQVAPMLMVNKTYVDLSDITDVNGAVKACITLTFNGNDVTNDIQPLVYGDDYTGADGAYLVKYVHYYQAIAGSTLKIDHKIAVNRTIIIE